MRWELILMTPKNSFKIRWWSQKMRLSYKKNNQIESLCLSIIGIFLREQALLTELPGLQLNTPGPVLGVVLYAICVWGRICKICCLRVEECYFAGVLNCSVDVNIRVDSYDWGLSLISYSLPLGFFSFTLWMCYFLFWDFVQLVVVCHRSLIHEGISLQGLSLSLSLSLSFSLSLSLSLSLSAGCPKVLCFVADFRFFLQFCGFKFPSEVWICCSECWMDWEREELSWLVGWLVCICIVGYLMPNTVHIYIYIYIHIYICVCVCVCV